MLSIKEKKDKYESCPLKMRCSCADKWKTDLYLIIESNIRKVMKLLFIDSKRCPQTASKANTHHATPYSTLSLPAGDHHPTIYTT